MTETNAKTYQVTKDTLNELKETFWKAQTLAKSVNMILFGQSENDSEAMEINACELSSVLVDYMQRLDDLLDRVESEGRMFKYAADPERIRTDSSADPADSVQV